MTSQKIRELTIVRTFDAPREIVFNAWIEPSILAQWWGPHGFTNPRVELDARPGGAILIHMQDPNGVVSPMTGVFNEVVPPERLVFTASALDNALEDITTVTFTDLGGKTQVTMHAEVTRAAPAAAQALAGMEEGWNQTLDRLAAFLRQRSH